MDIMGKGKKEVQMFNTLIDLLPAAGFIAYSPLSGAGLMPSSPAS